MPSVVKVSRENAGIRLTHSTRLLQRPIALLSCFCMYAYSASSGLQRLCPVIPVAKLPLHSFATFSLLQVRVIEARNISPPGRLTAEEPIDVSIQITFAGQEEVRVDMKSIGDKKGLVGGMVNEVDVGWESAKHAAYFFFPFLMFVTDLQPIIHLPPPNLHFPILSAYIHLSQDRGTSMGPRVSVRGRRRHHPSEWAHRVQGEVGGEAMRA